MKAAKFLAAMVAATALVGIVACSDEEQDVNVVSDLTDRSQYHEVYYTATGSVVTTTTDEMVTSEGTTNTTKIVETYTPKTDVANPATIAWTDSTLSNRTQYSITIPATLEYDANGSKYTYSNSISDTLTKYLSTYYVGVDTYNEDGLSYTTDVEAKASISALTTSTYAYTTVTEYYYWSDGSSAKYSSKKPTLSDTVTYYTHIKAETVANITLTPISE